jgi:hypothetical protein
MSQKWPNIVEIPPPPGIRDELDEFGLPLFPLSLLSTEHVKKKVSDLFDDRLRKLVEVGVRHFGIDEVQRRMKDNLPKKPRGQPPDPKLRREIVKEFMREFDKHPEAKRQIAKRMAKKKYRLEPLKADSFESQIRRVMREETVFRAPRGGEPTLLQMVSSEKTKVPRP